jgi:hypothetical protein
VPGQQLRGGERDVVAMEADGGSGRGAAGRADRRWYVVRCGRSVPLDRPGRPACQRGHPRPVDGEVVTVVDGRQTVIVTVRPDGFDPADVAIHAGLPTTLVLRARHASGCIRTVVIAGRTGQSILPVDGDTRVDLGVTAAGVVHYACVMGMCTAQLTAR